MISVTPRAQEKLKDVLDSNGSSESFIRVDVVRGPHGCVHAFSHVVSRTTIHVRSKATLPSIPKWPLEPTATPRLSANRQSGTRSTLRVHPRRHWRSSHR